MDSSKLTSKFQATIPKKIRDSLSLKTGDTIIFEVLKDGTAVIKKLRPLDKAYLQALNYTLEEWNSPEDEEAYEHLQSI